MEVERELLTSQGFSPQVTNILLASRRESTKRVYGTTWKRFSSWAISKGVKPTKAKIPLILSFLQEGLAKGLSTNTLKRQTAAISSILGAGSGTSIATHPHVKRFLRGVSLLNPPSIHRFPTWDLNKVLDALMHPPFEPLNSVPVRILSFKVLFLVAITSARRVSELSALSVHPRLCIVHKDRVVLRLDPSFIPKVNTPFHRAQELILPNFCPNPTHPTERLFHKLDVRRAVRIYRKRTSDLRRTESFFVTFGGPNVGRKASSSSLARWIKSCIIMAYQAIGENPPDGITAHSVRSAATSAAFDGYASLQEICRAATWSSVHTFTRHYLVDTLASAEAAMGRRVLQQVVHH